MTGNYYKNMLRDNLFIGTEKKTGLPVFYRKRYVPMHILGVGRTGTGKTNFGFNIVSQFIHDDCGVWIFDRKQDFRHLLRIFADDVLVFNPTNFDFNPWLSPPCFPAEEWLEIATDVYCRSHGLLGLGQSVLYTTAHGVFEKRGVFDGSGNYPCFYEVYEALEKRNFRGKRRSAESRDSLCRRMEVTMTANKGMRDCYVGFDLEELSKKNVVYELTGSLEELANYFINVLLYWIFAYRIGKQERGGKLRNVVVLDESRYVLSPWELPALGHRPIVHMLAMLREFGGGLLAMDSTANLHECIYENSALKLLWPIGSGDSLMKVGRAMGLSAEQLAYTYSLGVGEVIIRNQFIEKTFVVKVPKFPLE